MSINFKEEMNEETLEVFKKMIDVGSISNPVVQDKCKALFDDITKVHKEEMKILEKIADQSISIEINEEGEIKEMSDGTKYLVTPNGWKRIE
jgi:phage gp36-like protein